MDARHLSKERQGTQRTQRRSAPPYGAPSSAAAAGRAVLCSAAAPSACPPRGPLQTVRFAAAWTMWLPCKHVVSRPSFHPNGSESGGLARWGDQVPSMHIHACMRSCMRAAQYNKTFLCAHLADVSEHGVSDDAVACRLGVHDELRSKRAQQGNQAWIAAAARRVRHRGMRESAQGRQKERLRGQRLDLGALPLLPHYPRVAPHSRMHKAKASAYAVHLATLAALTACAAGAAQSAP